MSFIRSMVLALCVAVVGSQALLISPILPDIALSFDISVVRAAWAIAAYSAATAISAFFLARFIDVYGPAFIVRFALIALIVGLGISGIAPSFGLLLLAQALCGLASGLILPACYAIGGLIAPKGSEARVTGRVIFGWSIAMVAGIPLAAWIADLSTWRAAFLAVGVCGALALLLFWSMFPADLGNRQSRPAPLSFAPLAWSGVSRLLFICFSYMVAFYASYTFLGTHVRASMGIEASQASAFVLAYGLGFGLAALADPLMDRCGPKRVLAPCFAALALIYFAMPLMINSWFVGLAFTGLWGFFNHFGLNVIVTLLTVSKPTRSGEVMGFYTTCTYIGNCVGTGVIAPLYAWYGFAAPTSVAGFMMALAALVWVLRPKAVSIQA